MNNTANKKDVFYIIVLILTFITVVVGATFAIYVFIKSPEDEGASAVYTGTFSISYLSGDKINFHYLYPTEKPTIDTVENVYKNNFKVTNTGSLDGEIEKIVIEINKNEFEETRIDPDTKNKGIILKYSLYNKDEEEISTGFIGGNEDKNASEVTIANNLELENNETEEYTLLIWLEDDTEDQNEYMKKEFEGTIRVDATQKKNFK